MRCYRLKHPKKLMRLSVQQFDVAIIGGGLIGASMARSISDASLNIAIIDQQAATELYSPTLDNRGLALSYLSAKFLEKLNIWSQLSAQAHPIKTVHVSEQGNFGFSRLSAANLQIPALGYVLSAGHLGAALVQGLELLAGVTSFRPIKIKNLNYSSQQKLWHIEFADKTISSKLLIGADGTDSIVRQKLNISVNIKAYNQSAIVTNLYSNQDHADVAYERFTETGVLALLPFGEKKLKLVWTVDNALLNNFTELSDTDFLDKAQTAFGRRLGKFISIDARKVFPISQQQTTKICSENAVLIGNAANTLHPVAAQGFNLGLRDVATLREIIVAGDSLEKYELMRAKDHQATQKNTNSLVELFASQKATVKLARSFAMLAAQFVPLINKRITAQGLGVWT
jgi:2-octaprenyl-6-methoxyphenol hydroxylase